jgi:mono/diheme cytochrome c family protein
MKILFIPIIALILSSCYYDNQEALNGNPNPACDTAAVKYSTHIVPILQNYCFVCHSAALVAEGGGGGYNFEDFITIQTLALNGHLFGAVNHTPGYSPMPKYGNILSDCNISTFKLWINNGALNN